MPLSDPYQPHDFTTLFTIVITGLAELIGLATYLGSRLTRQKLRARTPSAAWRDLSLLTVAASLAVYLWGCLHVLFLERQDIGTACAKKAEGIRVAAFHGDFLPLRLVCRTDAGHSYTVIIPGYLNPAGAVLLLSALACGITSLLCLLRQRTAIRNGPLSSH